MQTIYKIVAGTQQIQVLLMVLSEVFPNIFELWLVESVDGMQNPKDMEGQLWKSCYVKQFWTKS